MGQRSICAAQRLVGSHRPLARRFGQAGFNVHNRPRRQVPGQNGSELLLCLPPSLHLQSVDPGHGPVKPVEPAAMFPLWPLSP